jgi:membrane fusion protein, multidrug efflux system
MMRPTMTFSPATVRLLCLLLVAGLAAACNPGMPGSNSGRARAAADGNTTLGPTPSPTPEEAPVPVKVQTVSRGDISTFLSTTATLSAEERVTVLSKGNGQVRTLRVEVGDRVRQGDLLAALDDDELRLARDRATLQVRQLEEKLVRTEELLAEKMVSREVHDDLVYQLENATLSLRTAELQLLNQRITAPLSGVVTERLIQRGDTIAPGTPTFTIVDMDSLGARVFVPESEARRMTPGQRVDLRSDSFPETVFAGEITRLAPVVDATTGTVEITVGFRELDPRLIPGMFVTVNIITATRQGVVLIPKRAIVRRNNEESVFVVEEGVAVRRVVNLGLADHRQSEVLSGLEGGEVLVVVGQRGLKDGARVEVAGEPTPTPAAEEE